MRFIFRNRFIILVAQKARNYINRYFNKVNLLRKIDLQKQWESQFLNQEYFHFDINNRVKIRLFRDSKLSELIYFGFEKKEQLFIATVLKEGDYFIDIGANIGLFTLIAADVVGPNGELIMVGGPAKANDLGKLGQVIKIYQDEAIARGGVVVKAYFAEGTPQDVIEFALKKLGSNNVVIFK